MFKIEAVATVHYTCWLSDEDSQKVIDYIKENPEEFEFMTDKEKIELLASDGMLIKRPLLISDKGIFIGFKEDIWKAL